jgi:putative methanogenesis marker protein 8
VNKQQLLQRSGTMGKKTGDEHIFETVGKCRVTVRHGKVVEICEPRIMGCPLAKRFEVPVDEITEEAVKKTIEQRIRSFGMCTARRKVMSDQEEFFGFAPTELLACGLRSGMIDAVVFACDGAGTVIITKPDMVLGIGGWMSGLVSTCPIPDVINRIEEHDGIVFDRATARLDSAGGADLARKRGFSRIAVPVSDSELAETIRANHPDALIFGVHMSGIGEDDARRIIAVSDLVTGCASTTVRTLAGTKALLQAGDVIPIFALTSRGKELMMKRILETKEKYFIKPTRLPVICTRQPEPLV